MNRISRRTLLAAAAGTAIAGLTPGIARAATEGWWATPGYTVGNTGFSQHETTILSSTVGRVTAKGTLLDGSTGLGAPVLDKGRIFVADATGITALSESTGARLWRYDYPQERTSTAHLVIRDGVLTAAWNHSYPVPPPSTFAAVATLDAATGAVLAEADDVMDGGFTRLHVDRGVILLAVENNRYGPGTLALRQSDLQELWSVAYYWFAAPASGNGRILLRGASPYITPHSSEIRDIVTGATLWSGSGFQYSALAANEAGTKFYVGWGHSLQIVDAATGASKWLASNVGPGQITATSGRLYVTGTGNAVTAFDATTDKPAFWSRTFGVAPLKPIIAGGVLYVTVPGDRVYALDPVTGATITTAPLLGTSATPVITNGRIYLTDGTKITTYGL